MQTAVGHPGLFPAEDSSMHPLFFVRQPTESETKRKLVY